MPSHEPITCPNCHHENPEPSDTCPNCRTPYAKWDIASWKRPTVAYQETSTFIQKDPTLESAQRQLTIAVGLLIVVGLLSWWKQGTGVMPEDIHPEVRKDPRQGPTQREPFNFEYRGASYEVKPVYSYKIAGLVVSHNDIGSVWDSYHTSDSVDTKDLCVIWGGNTLVDTFNLVNFSSGSWTCYARWGPGVSMNLDELSNNHLITNQDHIRDLIAKTRVGDQVVIEGMLVNYRQPGKMGWRNSSTTRDDTGNTACEVVFVEDMRVLKRGTPILYTVTTLSWWLVIASLIAKGVLFAIQLRRG